MARPTHTTIAGSPEGWDAAIDDNFSNAFTTPFPPAQYASTGDLPAASLYDGCVAHVTGDGLYLSDGTNWVRMAEEAAAVADAAGWSDATAQTKFNELLTALRASGALAP